MKYKKDNFDGVKPAPKCVQATKCTEQNIGIIATEYLVADIKYDQFKEVEKKAVHAVDNMNDAIDAHTFATMTTCDAA